MPGSLQNARVHAAGARVLYGLAPAGPEVFQIVWESCGVAAHCAVKAHV